VCSILEMETYFCSICLMPPIMTFTASEVKHLTSKIAYP
jgi:hypothetical protein